MGSHAASVRLAWDPNSEPDVVGYRVYYGTAPESYSNSVDSGSATEAELVGLAAGVQYYFSVTAYNAEGVESSYSDPISYRAPAPPARSRYVGLFGEGESGAVGSFVVNVSAKGKASGRLKFGGKVYAWTGVFSNDGTLLCTIPGRGGQGSLTLSLTITDDGAGMSGTLSDGNASIAASGKRATRGTTAVKSTYRGRYTAVLASSNPQAEGGYGYAAGNVSFTGVFRLATTLPDGTRCAFAGPIDDTGSLPMLALVPGGKGVLFGRVQFREIPDESDADAELHWTSGMQTETALSFRAARYVAGPASIDLGGASLAIFPASSSTVEGVLTASTPVTLVASASGGEQISLKLTMPSGLFTGSCIGLDGKSRKFAGAVFSKGLQRGYGRLRDAVDSGAVKISAAPGL